MRAGFAAIRLVALPVVLAVASCASLPPAPASFTQEAGGAATILAVRPIIAVGADGSGWRAALLNGARGAPDAEQPTTGAEFIIRNDSGAVLSIVQSNAAGLHQGERVVITHATGRPGLTRLL